MSIVVIGAITRDTLIFMEGNKCRKTESLGGILYIVLALSYLTENIIYPVVNVGYDIFKVVKKLLKDRKNVDLTGLKEVNVKNIHCYILYASQYGTQYDEGKEVPISFEQVRSFLSNANFIIISPMTGFEINLDTVKKIRKSTKAPIYFDYHILSLARDPLGNRFLYKRSDWMEWCINCDYLQLNKFEAELLYGKGICSEMDVLNFSKSILEKGVKAIAITLGPDGVFVSYHEDNDVKIKHIKGIRVDRVIDATGCGDVFAAGFISHYLKTKNILESYEFANKIAALKVKISGFQNLSKLIKMI
jgi:adenosine kinase